MGLAREANGYTFTAFSAGLDRKAPWFQIKEDKQAAATSVYVTRSVRVVDNLKTLLAPVLPHTAQQLHEYLGYEGQLFGTQQVPEYQEETRSHQALTYDHSGAVGTWSKSELPALKGAFGSGAGPARAGAALQKAGRDRDRRGVREAGRVRGEVGHKRAGAQVPALSAIDPVD